MCIVCAGGLRVPAIAYWPGVIKPSVTNALAQNVDLFPTVQELAGMQGGEQGQDQQQAVVLDGVSMVPIFRGSASNREGVIYYPQFTRRDRGRIRHQTDNVLNSKLCFFHF